MPWIEANPLSSMKQAPESTATLTTAARSAAGLFSVTPIAPEQESVSGVVTETLTRYQSLLILAVLLVVLAGLQALLPLGTAVKIGQDEDYELAKATLLNHGYRLYTEIWDDQPPLITVLVAKLSTWSRQPILAPRLMTVAFAVLLLAAVFILIRSINGPWAASIATTLLVGSPGFVELSSSVMQEMPALAAATTALCLVWLLPKRFGVIAGVLAGVVFGFALQLKLIGLIYLALVPVILLLRIERDAGGQPITFAKISSIRIHVPSLVKMCFVFGFCAASTFVVLNGLTGNSLLLQIRQAWTAHFAEAQSLEYGSPHAFGFQWSVLIKNWDATVPALVGLGFILSKLRERREMFLPLAWFALAFTVFGTHKPWWAYYYIHTAIPVCWCAGIGFCEIWRWGCSRFFKPALHDGADRKAGPMRRRPIELATGRRWPVVLVLAIFALCASAWIVARLYLEEQTIRSSRLVETELVIKEIERFKPFTTFMFSDRPIYSFLTDVPMPPHLGVISLKRFWTGDLSRAGIAAELENVKPGLILLGSQTQEPPYDAVLSREYRLVYQDAENRLYAHESISKKPQL